MISSIHLTLKWRAHSFVLCPALSRKKAFSAARIPHAGPQTGTRKSGRCERPAFLVGNSLRCHCLALQHCDNRLAAWDRRLLRLLLWGTLGLWSGLGLWPLAYGHVSWPEPCLLLLHLRCSWALARPLADALPLASEPLLLAAVSDVSGKSLLSTATHLKFLALPLRLRAAATATACQLFGKGLRGLGLLSAAPRSLLATFQPQPQLLPALLPALPVVPVSLLLQLFSHGLSCCLLCRWCWCLCHCLRLFSHSLSCCLLCRCC